MDDREVQAVIENIKKDFVDFHKDSTNLLSLFVVGSLIDKKYNIKKINDLDIRGVYENVTPRLLQKIKDFCSDLSSRYSTNDLDISYSLKAGIVKPPVTNKKRSLLIHFVLFSRADYLRIPRLHAFTFSRFNEYLSGPLKPTELRLIDQISLDDVKTEMEGIKHSIEMIEGASLSFLEYEVQGADCELGFKSMPINDDRMSLEIVYHSIKWNILDLLYALGQEGSNEDLLSNFLKLKNIDRKFGRLNTGFLKRLENIYADYRDNNSVNTDLDEIKRDAVIFLESLCEIVEDLVR